MKRSLLWRRSRAAIILHETKPGQEGFEKTGYRYVETAAGYRIYLQDGVYLGLDYEQGE